MLVGQKGEGSTGPQQDNNEGQVGSKHPHHNSTNRMGMGMGTTGMRMKMGTTMMTMTMMGTRTGTTTMGMMTMGM